MESNGAVSRGPDEKGQADCWRYRSGYRPAVAKQDYAVCVNYLNNSAAADAVVHSVERAGGRALAVAAEVAREADVVRSVETMDMQLGLVTALVNNAGIVGQRTTLADMDTARLHRIFSTNITGSFLRAREAIHRMSTKQGGVGDAIVNVSSVASRLESPGEYIDYAASKGALDTMTIGLAKEVATEGIRANSVRPGIIYTDIHASGGDPDRVERLKEVVSMKRSGQAEEVAKAILWLLSDEASYSTVTFIDVSGGR